MLEQTHAGDRTFEKVDSIKKTDVAPNFEIDREIKTANPDLYRMGTFSRRSPCLIFHLSNGRWRKPLKVKLPAFKLSGAVLNSL